MAYSIKKMVKIINGLVFGIEIEIASCLGGKAGLIEALRSKGIACRSEFYNHNTRDYWKIVDDASVSGGFELVSPICKGQDGLDEVELVCEALEMVDAQVDRRCGLHVHHDATQIKGKFADLVQLYQNLENTIDTIMPPSRRGQNNGYCKTVKGKTEENLVADRYHKVNLDSYLKHGTAEFRQHSGTVEFPKIGGWIMITGILMAKVASARKPLKPATFNTFWQAKNYMGIDFGEGYDDYPEYAKLALHFFNKRHEYFCDREGYAHNTPEFGINGIRPMAEAA